jgi:hypothetical protein
MLLASATFADGEIDLRYSQLVAVQPPTLMMMQAAADDPQQSFLDMSQTREGKSISMKKAMLLSLLFPGAGQYYAGSTFKGQVFMGTETAIWAGFIAYRVYGGWKTDDYKAYAEAHAGVSAEGKSDEYFDWIGFYENREEFNEFGRLYYPDRAYIADNAAYDWQWDSQDNRLQYKDMKDDAKTAFRNSTFLIGLAIANRVIAAIDTYRTVRKAQSKMNSFTQFGDYKLTVSPKVFGDNPRVSVKLTKKF